ncbi:SET and MYND domain-containing protein 4-like [Diachasmimorpha longicaudata]|uniref:SET and MYND domain-containing protein 4-like n=1 Tax=Diachasmimorpha longicaudata TaxID=58733 RepID=UPI0030B8C99F
MEDMLNTLKSKILASGKHKLCHSEYALLKTDSDRVKYTIQILIDNSMVITPINTNKSLSASADLWRRANQLLVSPSHRDRLDECFEAYTQSIAVAPTGTEGLSLAYANRSVVLYKAHLYQDCLLDISRALALPYPDKLKSKLYTRQARCLMTRENTSESQKKEVEDSLGKARLWLEKMDPMNQGKSVVEKTLMNPEKMMPTEKPFVKWNPHKNIPSIADENPEISGVSSCLELKYSEQSGKHVVATRDIFPGETLAIMEPYAAVLLTPEKSFTHCWRCMEQTWSSIPCPNCVNVVFCSEDCREKAWEEHHYIECDVIGPLLALEMSHLGLLSMRMAVQAIKEAGGIKELMKKVEEIENKVGRTNGFTGGILNDKDYASVYTLTRNTEKRSVADLFGRSLNAALIIYILATTSELFGKRLPNDLKGLLENEEAMFVAGLIMRHQQIIPSNAHEIAEEVLGIDPIGRAAAIMPFYSLINHSCSPGVGRTTYGKKMVIYSDAIIRQGEEVFDNYGAHFAIMPKIPRQQFLAQQFRFKCNCEACLEDWPTYNRIPSFEHQQLSEEDKLQIRRAATKCRNYHAKTKLRQLDNAPKMIQDLQNVIKTIMLYGNLPCQELNEAVEIKKRIYALLGNQYQSLNRCSSSS